MTDADLVRRARAGDREAFGWLVERHQDAARRVALRMISNAEIVHELVQEAFLQAYLSLDQLRDATRFRSWLFGILLNLCRGNIREATHSRVDRNLSLEEDSAERLDAILSGSLSPDPKTVAEERDLYRRILAAVDELPPAVRQATLLHYFQYLSLQEIAALLNVTPGTVKVRLHRARQSLKQQLEQSDPDLFQTIGNIQRRQTMVDRVKVMIWDVIKHDDKYIVLLKEEAGERMVPIWIGPYEGHSIVMGIRKVSTPRPMTYAFIERLLKELDARLEEVRVESIQGNTFYGVAKVRGREAVHEVDARPSDILALAARTGCPIFVTEEVMEQNSRMAAETDCEFPPLTGEGKEVILKEIETMLGGWEEKKEANRQVDRWVSG